MNENTISSLRETQFTPKVPFLYLVIGAIVFPLAAYSSFKLAMDLKQVVNFNLRETITLLLKFCSAIISLVAGFFFIKSFFSESFNIAINNSYLIVSAVTNEKQVVFFNEKILKLTEEFGSINITFEKYNISKIMYLFYKIPFFIFFSFSGIRLNTLILNRE